MILLLPVILSAAKDLNLVGVLVTYPLIMLLWHSDSSLHFVPLRMTSMCSMLRMTNGGNSFRITNGTLSTSLRSRTGFAKSFFPHNVIPSCYSGQALSPSLRSRINFVKDLDLSDIHWSCKSYLYQSLLRSIHLGLAVSISSIFFLLSQPLMVFSLAIAEVMSVKAS